MWSKHEDMGHWTIRILRDVYPDGQEYFFPAEVYFHEGEKVPHSYGGFSSEAETPEDVRWYLQEAIKACDRPILHAGEAFPAKYEQE